jgi:dimethylglycine catabolism A
MPEYPHLFTPLTIRDRTIPNRIVSTPHATGWELPGGLISDKEVDYHVRKAAGGVGLVMTFGSATVDPTTAASYGSIALWNADNEPQLRRIVEGVHAHGGLVISQTTHMGHRGSSRKVVTPVRGVSDLPEPEHREVASPLEVEELHTLVQRFVDVALRLHRCGWDGVEVTSFAHLIEQFWNPAINNRTDEYGGSLENRMRFGKQVVAAVRAAVPDDFIVAFRMSLDPLSNGRDIGTSADELHTIATEMAATGDIDLLSVTVGDGMTRPALSVAMGSDFVSPVPGGDAAAKVTAEVNIPVLLAGRILSGETAEETLDAGKADLVGMTRAVIADPDLPNKLRDGRRIRPCIGINQGCIGRLYSGFPVLCSVNPAIRDPSWRTCSPRPDRVASSSSVAASPASRPPDTRHEAAITSCCWSGRHNWADAHCSTPPTAGVRAGSSTSTTSSQNWPTSAWRSSAARRPPRLMFSRTIPRQSCSPRVHGCASRSATPTALSCWTRTR